MFASDEGCLFDYLIYTTLETSIQNALLQESCAKPSMADDKRQSSRDSRRRGKRP